MGQKRKLTKGQQRRIHANQAKRLARRDTEETQVWSEEQLGPLQPGRVVSRFGQHADILDADANIYRCNIRRAVQSLVTGDKVAWRKAPTQEQGMQGVVEAVEERESELCRPDIYDGLKPVAANIEQIFIVSSPQPAFSDQIIDRYLVACEDAGIQPIIVMNKTDLMTPDEAEFIQERLSVYQRMGYSVVRASAATGEGIEELRQCFIGKISVLVGQSGVGKSSLIDKTLPEVSLLIGDISVNSGLGQHTTTVARWYPLNEGGALIDSPGIREFGLWHMSAERITQGFVDFHPFLGTCKFRDCRHDTDPGCALQQAVAEGKLDARRLANFHRIIDSLEKS
ncbi:ribosome biogenesis GTPase RsgA [Aliidiomarina taiwanensis]|uniref:Small ribosomal subunit biogenesis GTPase RsgA n=1 Tax=Aliidiomarina taiwanensis TaxID=946228 RepID=A0A432WYZ0_9GAMM|nr:small ribosomal subunit biogenesis GTPase RsgA [Aliidiomarina taiwanensis]RUO38901.1 ribosome biogenesis GTPase RsgA [Aliidiomarina taiwanensis]